MDSVSCTRTFAENGELISPLFGPRTLSPAPRGRLRGAGWIVGRRRKHLKSTKRERRRSYYAPYRLLSRVHIFAVLNPAAVEFWPQSLSSLLREEGAGGSLVAGVWAPWAGLSSPAGGDSWGQEGFLWSFSRPPELLKCYLCNWSRMPC